MYEWIRLSDFREIFNKYEENKNIQYFLMKVFA